MAKPAQSAEIPPCPPLTSRAEAESALAQLAVDTNALNQIETALAAHLAAIRADVLPETERLKQVIKQRGDAIEQWAWQAKQDEFAEAKSIELLPGTIGFRWGNRGLGLLARQKWETVLERLRGRFKKYVRLTEDVDKKKILADSAGDDPALTAADLSSMGIKIVQEESFFIELKKT